MRTAEPTFEKPLPTNLEAERMVLGCGILDNAVIEQAALLAECDFFSAANRQTFAAMLRMKARGEAIDPLTLKEELRRAGELERVGGMYYLSCLIDGVPRFSNIENYVRLVKDASRERRLIEFGNSVMARAWDGEDTIDEQLRQAEQELALLGSDRGEGHWEDIAGVACDVLVEAESRAASGRQVLDFASGFRDLDFITDGFERKTMVVVAAAPKMGKTGFALSLTRKMSEAEENLIDGQPPVIGWFSMEMSKKQQARRLVASVAGIDLRRLRTGNLTKDEWRTSQLAAQKLAGWRVYFDDRAALSPRKMREGVRKLKNDQGRIDILFVDYLQLGDGEKQKGETREQEVARMSKSLLQIAKDYNCLVVVMSQLNRELFSRKDKRPTMGDIRDSGQIGQDAHVVIGLYRDEVYNPESDKRGTAELIMLAQREGPLGTVEVMCKPEVMRFEDVWNQQQYNQ